MLRPVALHPASPAAVTLSSILTGAGSVAAALVVAALALYWRRPPVLRRVQAAQSDLRGLMRSFQSGVINDYVTWIVVGLAGIGGALALLIR